MSDLTITNFSKDLQQRLSRRAARQGRTVEAEVRAILREAVKDESKKPRRDPNEHLNLYDAIRAIVEPHGGYDTSDMPPRHPPPERVFGAKKTPALAAGVGPRH